MEIRDKGRPLLHSIHQALQQIWDPQGVAFSDIYCFNAVQRQMSLQMLYILDTSLDKRFSEQCALMFM